VRNARFISGLSNKESNNHSRILGMNLTFIFWIEPLKKIKTASCTSAAIYDFSTL
jgi:hypothetical protein